MNERFSFDIEHELVEYSVAWIEGIGILKESIKYKWYRGTPPTGLLLSNEYIGISVLLFLCFLYFLF